jgi:hypothetical protein
MDAEARTPGKLIAFVDVRLGDTVTFATRDNGFGGSGDFIHRTGTVQTITDKSVIVGGVRALRSPTWPAESSGTARLRRADWYDRSVRLVAAAEGDR